MYSRKFKRKIIWNAYYEDLKHWAKMNNVGLPTIPKNSTNNAHMFYLVCENNIQRNKIISHMKDNQIDAVFHYLSLHKSPYFEDKYKGGFLNNSDLYSERLVRLPFYIGMDYRSVINEINKINE